MAIKSTFTEEAMKLLEKEGKALADELRQAAINEALSSRGEPVEVTASDVRKAKESFQTKALKLRPLTPLLLKLYIWFGLFLVCCSTFAILLSSELYQVSRPLALLGLTGLSVSIIAYMMTRFILDARLKSRIRRPAEQEERQHCQ
jgi:hypothetical protein